MDVLKEPNTGLWAWGIGALLIVLALIWEFGPVGIFYFFLVLFVSAVVFTLVVPGISKGSNDVAYPVQYRKKYYLPLAHQMKFPEVIFTFLALSVFIAALLYGISTSF